jgi:drug/metabolite transporter (DMT)-like permease
VRVVIGAAVLVGLAWRSGALAPLRGRVRWLVAFAALEIVVPFPLIAAGEQRIDSSLAAIIIATAPLFVALLALRFDTSERVGGQRLAGLVIGLVGVVALVGVDIAGRAGELLGAAALLTAALGYAAGPMVFKRHLADLDPKASMGGALVVAALVLAPAAAFDPPADAPSLDAVVSLLVLGLVCTAAGLVLYGMLVGEVGAGRAVLITYVNPVVAVALGIAFLDESLGAGAALGLVLILLGSWASTRAEPGPGRAAAAAVPEAQCCDSAEPPAVGQARTASSEARD